ncbi:hypothetical protein PRIC1_004757 [Phytophthora ramorum]
MVSTASLFAAAVATLGCLTTHVQAHGYMLIPQTEFKGTATGAWSVEIAPQFQANWESVADDTELIALYAEKATEAGYANNIRKLLDSDTSLYGADCGFSDPNAKAKDPPSDGTATFERGLAHHGPCEIWLDDTMVLHNDDCAKAFSVEDYMSIKSVFKPIDYSSCSSSGCMFRFYWLAFQGSTSGKYVWQIYKDCIPLTGPGAGQTSTATASSMSNTTQTSDTPPTNTASTEAPTTGDQTATTMTPTFTQSPTTMTPTSTEAPATMTPTSTQAPASMNQVTPAPQTGNSGASATQSPMAPTTWGNSAGATEAPSTSQAPAATEAAVWQNTPTPESPATVAPIVQTQTTQAPASAQSFPATNTPNSYSFSTGAPASNVAGEADVPTVAPSFTF